MKTEIVHFGSFPCDSHGLGDHVLVYRAAVIPGKHKSVHIGDDLSPPFLPFDLVENFENPIG